MDAGRVEVLLLPGATAPDGLPAEAAAGPRAPLLVVSPGVASVSDGAIDRLLAGLEDTVATVSAFGAARPAAEPVRPRVPGLLPGLVLVARAALDLAGPVGDDEASLRAFGARCSALGLLHVLADDVLIDGGTEPPAPQGPGEPLERVLHVAAGATRRLSVTVDARALGPYRAGTQTHLLELVLALARTTQVDVRVLVAHDLSADAAEAFAAHERISTISYEDAIAPGVEPTDLVHRPSQVFSADDLALLLPLGRRLVVTHQDLISYHSPAGHASPQAWHGLRTTTRMALGAADHVVFFTAHARDDALREDLVDERRSTVVPIGVDHQVVGQADAERPAAIGDAPYLLALGADLPHKNLPFAAALVGRLRGLGWPGRLVLAGPSTTSSVPEGPDVTRLGAVSEGEKRWLLEHAAAVAYPTLYEGFGLIPFEAAAAGVPCAFAPVASLAELLPVDAAVLVPWDAAASAAALLPLLEPGAARDAHLALVRAAAGELTWDRAAAELVDVYGRTLRSPLAEAQRGPAERLAFEARLEAELVEARRLREDFLEYQRQFTHDGLALVGRDGFLDADDQRALLPIAARPALRKVLLGPVRLLQRRSSRG